MLQPWVSLSVRLAVSTWYRTALIRDGRQSRLHEFFEAILREQECELVTAGDMPDQEC